jgi:hypothetical protein
MTALSMNTFEWILGEIKANFVDNPLIKAIIKQQLLTIK